MWNLATGQATFVDVNSGSLGQTLGVNNSGEAVGVYDEDFGGSAFLYTGGKFIDLGQGNYRFANAINDQGVVVGTNTTSTGSTGVFIYSNSAIGCPSSSRYCGRPLKSGTFCSGSMPIR